MADERMVEAVALVRALAKDPRAQEPAPRRAKAFEWAMQLVLEAFEVAPSSPDATRVRGDFAVVVAAYERALEDEKVRASDVRRRLLKVLDQVDKIRDLLADGAIGRQARLRVEEMLLDDGLADLDQPVVGKDRPQLAASNARSMLAAARLAARQRRGLDAAHSDVEAVNVGLSDGLVAAAGPLSPSVLAAAERAEALAGDEGGLTDALVDVMRRAIDTLPQDGASHASLSPPAGLTLAWAALEIVDAWRPRGLMAAADEGNPVKDIAARAFAVVHPHGGTPSLINPVRKAVDHRNTGHPALAFEGRYSREERVRDAEDRWLARIQAEDAGSDPAAGEPDVDLARPIHTEPPQPNHRRTPSMLHRDQEEQV